MYAPVVDHAAAGDLEFTPALDHTALTVYARLDRERCAYHAGLVRFFHDPVIGVPAPVLVNGEQLARPLRRRVHEIEFGDAQRDRFFADYVVAGFKRAADVFAVKVVRRGDENDVKQVRREKFIRRFECNKPFFRRVFKALFAYIVSRNDFKVGEIRFYRLMMPPRHTAVTDYT